ncbi:nitrile hydratase subunit alpha [Pseudonocardia sp. NPDC046786]|uniref:nitrile hydratase subunit alpha n=1 Tax=Pseudonocardia sp. NPDC046786 TaxID=3155471 RepID=UPI0033E6E757
MERLEQELVGRGVAGPGAIGRWSDAHADELGPRWGSQAVARVWLRRADGLGRCGCGRRWRLVRDTASVRNVIVPAAPGVASCSGWRVLGMPPSWYRPAPGAPRRVRFELSEGLGHRLDTNRRVRIWTDDPVTHHLVVPIAPQADLGPFELAGLVGRLALRGLSGVARQADPPVGPRWAQRYPGYPLDERIVERPWELRAVALLLATAEGNPALRAPMSTELTAAAEKLPVRGSIYTAWLQVLARLAR